MKLDLELSFPTPIHVCNLKNTFVYSYFACGCSDSRIVGASVCKSVEGRVNNANEHEVTRNNKSNRGRCGHLWITVYRVKRTEESHCLKLYVWARWGFKDLNQKHYREASPRLTQQEIKWKFVCGLWDLLCQFKCIQQNTINGQTWSCTWLCIWWRERQKAI